MEWPRSTGHRSNPVRVSTRQVRSQSLQGWDYWHVTLGVHCQLSPKSLDRDWWAAVTARLRLWWLWWMPWLSGDLAATDRLASPVGQVMSGPDLTSRAWDVFDNVSAGPVTGEAVPSPGGGDQYGSPSRSCPAMTSLPRVILQVVHARRSRESPPARSQVRLRPNGGLRSPPWWVWRRYLQSPVLRILAAWRVTLPLPTFYIFPYSTWYTTSPLSVLLSNQTCQFVNIKHIFLYRLFYRHTALLPRFPPVLIIFSSPIVNDRLGIGGFTKNDRSIAPDNFA